MEVRPRIAWNLGLNLVWVMNALFSDTVLCSLAQSPVHATHNISLFLNDAPVSNLATIPSASVRHALLFGQRNSFSSLNAIQM